ncbi:MAG TPA: RNA-binding protein [Hyphomicrobiaceae bacterium]|nr:RNA-binding protein [Hyphomicrobiaceae bacterium]
MTDETRSQGADNPPAAPQRGRGGASHPVRTCIVTKQDLPQSDLLRFACGPDGTVVADLAGKLPGRGVYVTAARAAVVEAAKKGAFSRAFKRQVAVPADLAELIEARLADAARQAFSLARKAGLVSTGFQKVEAEIAAGRVAVLVHAGDGRPDGIGKLDRKYRAVQADSGRPALIFTGFSSDELSLAIGGKNVIHAALAAGGQTRAFVRCVERLQRFRVTGDAKGTAGVINPLADHVFSSTDQAGTDQNERYE